MNALVSSTRSVRGARGTRFNLTVVRRSLAADGPRVLVMELTDPVGHYPPGSVLLKLVSGAHPRVHETRWAGPPADLASAITAARVMLAGYRD